MDSSESTFSFGEAAPAESAGGTSSGSQQVGSDSGQAQIIHEESCTYPSTPSSSAVPRAADASLASSVVGHAMTAIETATKGPSGTITQGIHLSSNVASPDALSCWRGGVVKGMNRPGGEQTGGAAFGQGDDAAAYALCSGPASEPRPFVAEPGRPGSATAGDVVFGGGAAREPVRPLDRPKHYAEGGSSEEHARQGGHLKQIAEDGFSRRPAGGGEQKRIAGGCGGAYISCLLYTSPSPRDRG